MPVCEHGKHLPTMEDVMNNIIGLNVAILNADGFEQVEMLKRPKVLDRAGAKTSTPLHATGRCPGCLIR